MSVPALPSLTGIPFLAFYAKRYARSRSSPPPDIPFLAFSSKGYVRSGSFFSHGHTFSRQIPKKVCPFLLFLLSQAYLFSLFLQKGMPVLSSSPLPGIPFLAFYAKRYARSSSFISPGHTFSCFFFKKVCPFFLFRLHRAYLFSLFTQKGMPDLSSSPPPDIPFLTFSPKWYAQGTGFCLRPELPASTLLYIFFRAKWPSTLLLTSYTPSSTSPATESSARQTRQAPPAGQPPTRS